MIAVDTNVLIYAHRDGFPLHRDALGWLKHLAEGSRPWALPVFCLGEFVRIATHPRVLNPPSTIEQALAAIDDLLASPSVRVLSPGPRYPSLFAAAVRQGDARGNLAFDAQIAALCRDQGVARLLTQDRDFARFPHIEVVTVDRPPD